MVTYSKHVRLVVVCLTILVARAAHADRLSADDLARKNERGYVTGLPLVAYSTDLGFGGGARAYYYWNGHRDDDRFDDTPYLHRVFLQVFAATRGVQFHWLDYDAPNVFRSPYRVRGQLIYGRNTNSNYFGLGGDALAPLSFPGSATTYDSFADYNADQRRATGGTTWAKYDNYDLQRPILLASVERNFWHDQIRVLAGIGITYAGIDDYTGQMVDAVDDSGAMTTATMETTRLRADCDAGLLVGCDGGRDNLLRLGISYDTRDFEPDPNRGVFVDLALDVGTVALGSEFDYLRFLAAARGYWSPTSRADLVLGGRVLFQVQSAGTPFFGMDTLSFTEDPRTGLGGHRTMRGYRQDRFVGPVMSALNLEARWTFLRGTLWKQKLGLILAPFFDVGRPFDEVSDVTPDDWRRSYGGALRISWNLATIITFDYGRSAEDSGFYANFSHMF
jgi:outer membrane protein assembly factor BamA